MKTINYESDFKLVEGFKDGSSITAAPFRFTYYTKVSRGVYVAEYNGSEYVNCLPTEDGKVIVPFDSPKLGMGQLMVKREFFLNDSDFADGVCNLVSVESTEITLDKGATDDLGTIEVEIEPFYHIISIGDGEVTTQKIANGAVTSEKIAAKAVSNSNLADLSVTMNKIATAAVTSDKIANNTVATNNLRDESVTEGKLSPSVKAMINKSGTTYRKEYSVLDTANNGWYLLAEVGDDDMALFQVSSKGHSDVLFSVATGWSGSKNGSLVILNSFTNGYNDNYAHVRGVRIRKQDGVAKVEIELKGPIVNTSGYVGIYATVFSNSNSNPLKDSLRQAVNVDQATIVQSYTLKDKAFMAEDVVAKRVEADNIIENIIVNGKTYPAGKTIDLGNIQGGGEISDVINKEIYYNDGSNKVVPIKHPDLSTQPSILPYKFMGNYVYERLVMTYMSEFSDSSIINIFWPSSLDRGKMYLDIKAILSYNNGLSIAIPIIGYTGDVMQIDGANIYNINKYSPIYLHVVYTSMPEEGNYYYEQEGLFDQYVELYGEGNFIINQVDSLTTSDMYFYNGHGMANFNTISNNVVGFTFPENYFKYDSVSLMLYKSSGQLKFDIYHLNECIETLTGEYAVELNRELHEEAIMNKQLRIVVRR